MNAERKAEMEEEERVVARINTLANIAADISMLTRELSEPGVIDNLKEQGADHFVGLGHLLEFLGDEIGNLSYDCFVRRVGR